MVKSLSQTHTANSTLSEKALLRNLTYAVRNEYTRAPPAVNRAAHR
jgi:hypothetical protein